MRFESPQHTRIAQLRALWKEAFGDSDVFLDAFFETGFSPDRCRCAVEADAVVSALYWFDGECENQRFAYLYAVATAKQARGRGVFTALLADVKQLLTAQGYDGILLMPETEALGKMYEKLGFSCCTKVDVCTVPAGQTPCALRETGPAEFARLRRERLPALSVLQEGALLPFLASQYRFYLGEDFLTAGLVHEGTFHAQEFLGNSDSMGGLVKALGAQEGIFRTPGKGRAFAYLMKLHESCIKPAYFALALD